MESFILDNGIKVIHKNNNSSLTSICISVDAGANVEGNILGLAHATEHMLYKGTTTRTENDINRELAETFGFQNAMTNYPYVIYYGTLLSEDFEKGIEIFSDILLNATFPEEGFQEEMEVIKEELKEWDEELEQYCEDKQFLNSFSNRRIKYPIIGKEEDLQKISLKNIREFYNEHYVTGNITIAVISSLESHKVKSVVSRYFKAAKSVNETEKFVTYEKNKAETFIDYKKGINSSKVQFIFDITTLSHLEIKALNIFNQFFAEGVNSILYQRLRTDAGLIYDIIPRVAYEKGIGLYKLTFTTSDDNVYKCITSINKAIESLSDIFETLEAGKIDKLIKSYRIKRLFREEQSIVVAKELATYDTMFKDYNIYVNSNEDFSEINKALVLDTGLKVMKNPSIQIISKVN